MARLGKASPFASRPSNLTDTPSIPKSARLASGPPPFSHTRRNSGTDDSSSHRPSPEPDEANISTEANTEIEANACVCRAAFS